MWALLSQQASGDGGIDISTALLAYGVAAPFAGLAFWQLLAYKKERDELRVENGRLRDAQLLREQQLVAGLAPRVYDAALLYSQAAAAPPTVGSRDQRMGELADAVEHLVAELGAGGFGARGTRGGAGGSGRGDPGGETAAPSDEGGA